MTTGSNARLDERSPDGATGGLVVAVERGDPDTTVTRLADAYRMIRGGRVRERTT